MANQKMNKTCWAKNCDKIQYKDYLYCKEHTEALNNNEDFEKSKPMVKGQKNIPSYS